MRKTPDPKIEGFRVLYMVTYERMRLYSNPLWFPNPIADGHWSEPIDI
jgi:hypothetical protein